MDFGKNQYRILVIDQFIGHLAPKVIGSIGRRHSRVPIFCWGGLTGLAQEADAYQTRAFKEVCRPEKSKASVRRVRQSPEWVPRPTRGDIFWCASRTRRHPRESTDFIPQTKLTFKRAGTNLKLNGSEDALIDSQLQKYWLDRRVCDSRDTSTWRADFCAAKDDEGPEEAYELIETLENPHSCPRGERSQERGCEIEDDVIELPSALLGRNKVARKRIKFPASGQESAI